LEEGNLRRLVYKKKEIDELLSQKKLQIQFDENGDKVCCFTDEYSGLCSGGKGFKHEIESEGKKRWCLKQWMESGSAKEQIYQMVYMRPPSDLVYLDQVNDPKKMAKPKLIE
jgi:hypothetical protein